MVAYGFKKFFVPQIESGFKRQTVRADRKRHAEPGELVQIYTAMRTKHCRKIIPDQKCLAREHIVIERRPCKITAIEVNGFRLNSDEIEEFAKTDGFSPEQLNGADGLDSHIAEMNMAMFWDRTHPGFTPFVGVLIRWSFDEVSP